jgi:hypothetical protein
VKGEARVEPFGGLLLEKVSLIINILRVLEVH